MGIGNDDDFDFWPSTEAKSRHLIKLIASLEDRRGPMRGEFSLIGIRQIDLARAKRLIRLSLPTRDIAVAFRLANED